MSDDPTTVYLTPPGHEFRTWTRMIDGVACACDFRGTVPQWRRHQYEVLLADIARAVVAELRSDAFPVADQGPATDPAPTTPQAPPADVDPATD